MNAMDPNPPVDIRAEEKFPEVIVVTYTDGAQIRYLVRSGGTMVPGYLLSSFYRRNGEPSATVIFFIPYSSGGLAIPEILKVDVN